MLVGPEGDPLLADLGPLDSLSADIAAAAGFVNRAARWAAAERLSERLLKPFADELATAKTVYLSPDGALNLLPFDLLPFAGADYWIEAQDVRLVSTGRALVQARGAPEASGLLALGGVDFERADETEPEIRTAAIPTEHALRSRSASRASGLEPFQPLPGSDAEIDALAAFYAAQTGEQTTLLRGPGAREDALKAAQTPRVLHLASHGFFREDDGRSQVNPMTLSGLALAGVNQSIRAAQGEAAELGGGAEDGVLWALEAMSLRLDGAQLVTLSACDTAQGVLDAGEGVYGLGRAFQIAGADNVLLTLWALNDDRARAFTADFYEHWLSGDHDDPAEALRATKLAWLGSPNPTRADPQVWAPYVLFQNGR